MLSEEAKKIRQGRITGTRIGKIVGLSKYGGPFDAWLEIKGLKDDLDETPDILRGNYLEDGVRQWYAHRQGMEVLAASSCVHPKYDYISATPDLFAKPRGTKDWDRVGEVKCPRYADDWGADGTDEVPEYHIAQNAFEMACTGFEQCDTIAFVWGDIRVYNIKRDYELEGLLLEAAHKFWRDHVVKDVAPEPDGSSSYAEWIAKRFSEHGSNMVEANPEAEKWAANLKRARVLKTKADELEAEAQAFLKTAIADAAGIQGDGWKITWKKTKDGKSVDWKALAEHLGASEEQVREFTKIKEGSRRFLVPRGWAKEE